MKKLLFFLLSIIPTWHVADSADSKLIWEAWYTMTLNEKIHYGYYHDRVELTQDKLHYQNHLWKKEEGFMNEEQLGAFSENTPDLKPLFFNFHSNYRSTETKIDGSMNRDTLTIRASRGGKELPLIKRNLPSKTFFSVFFPLWLQRKISHLSVGKRENFSSLFEDSLNQNYPIELGWIRLEKPDAIAQQTQTKKISVSSRDVMTLWYVTSSGMPIRIEMPKINLLVQKTTRPMAENFLKNPD